MKEITFITGNQNKADYLAKFLDHPVKHQKLDLDEIQTLDVVELVEHKVRQAYDLIKSPVLVEDSSLSFKALGGLPGPFIKFFVDNIPLQDICDLLKGKDRGAVAKAVFGYYDGEILRIIESGLDGTIATSPAGSNGWDWDQIFISKHQTVTNSSLSKEEYAKTYLQIKPFAELKQFLQSIN